MDLHVESQALEHELETGIQHKRIRFDGQGVTFTARRYEVAVSKWELDLDVGPDSDLLAAFLQLEGISPAGVLEMDAALSLPGEAFTPHGAKVVRLRVQPHVLSTIVKPALSPKTGLPDLLSVRDPSGLPLFFNLANYDLLELIPAT